MTEMATDMDGGAVVPSNAYCQSWCFALVEVMVRGSDL